MGIKSRGNVGHFCIREEERRPWESPGGRPQTPVLKGRRPQPRGVRRCGTRRPGRRGLTRPTALRGLHSAAGEASRVISFVPPNGPARTAGAPYNCPSRCGVHPFGDFLLTLNQNADSQVEPAHTGTHPWVSGRGPACVYSSPSGRNKNYSRASTRIPDFKMPSVRALRVGR